MQSLAVVIGSAVFVARIENLDIHGTPHGDACELPQRHSRWFAVVWPMMIGACSGMCRMYSGMCCAEAVVTVAAMNATVDKKPRCILDIRILRLR